MSTSQPIDFVKESSDAVQTRLSTGLNWGANAVSVFISGVFLDSLRFKFTNAPKTQVIFGDLDALAATYGAQGLFAPTGLFSQYVIGSSELVASIVLVAATFTPRLRFLRPAAAALSLAIMTGAISFHLLTPLGINVAGDGGALFYTACGVWIGALALLLGRRSERRDLLQRLSNLLAR